jgi:NAD(P)-dependent dehydrogenase (short-subunit alcohol dehydrogenase family)
MIPRTVLVTGAGKRIGRAIALHLAGSGWTIAAHYNESEAEACDLVETIRGQGGRAGAF